jgi:lysophospholipase L1-like esterase
VPVYQDRWGINEKTVIQGVIPVIKKVAKDKKLPVIDLHQALSGKPKMFPDKIHPNAAGAKLMAETIQAALNKKQK